MAGLLVPVGLALPRLLRAQSAPAFDFYISPTGNDSAPGTLAQPWAITSLSPYTGSPNYSKIPGKRIGLLPGTYGVSSIMLIANTAQPPLGGPGNNGDAYNNIALDIPGGTSSASTYIASSDANGNYSPRTATIQANDNGYYGAGNSVKCSVIGHSQRGYVTFDGLKITGGSLSTMVIGQTAGTNYSPPGIVIQNCELYGCNAQSSTITSGENCGALEIMSGAGVLIQNNYFHDNSGYPGSIGEDHFSAIYHWGYGTGGTSGTRILYNTFVNSGGLQGKEGNQWGTEIAYNYIDMSTISPAYASPICAGVAGFCADSGSGAGSVTKVHHNIIVGYGQNVSPTFFGGTWIDMTFSNAQCYWDYPLEVYNNTCIASSAMNGCGFAMFEKTAGSRLFSVYNNLIYDGGHNSVAQYGWWLSNADAFAVLDYNIYGTNPTSGNWASVAAAGTYPNPTLPSLTEASSLASWQSTVGADAHSVASSANPFTNTGPGALQYQVGAGSPAHQFGRVGGTSGGAACHAGAWDGAVTQIGCDFATASIAPSAPQLTVS